MDLTFEWTPHALTGRLLAVSGVRGSGKTTLADGLEAVLAAEGQAVIRLKLPSPEFSRYPPFRRYRDDETTVTRGELDLTALTLLALGDALLTVRTRIVPALREGAWVVCERYLVPALAGLLEAGAPEADLTAVRRLSRLFPAPDLAVVTRAGGGLAPARVAARGRPGDEGARLDGGHFGRTDAAFVAVGRANGALIVDVDRAAAEVLAAAMTEVRRLGWPAPGGLS